MESDSRVLFADVLADLEAHGLAIERLRAELQNSVLSTDALASLGSRERELETEFQRLRQRVIALKGSLT